MENREGQFLPEEKENEKPKFKVGDVVTWTEEGVNGVDAGNEKGKIDMYDAALVRGGQELKVVEIQEDGNVVVETPEGGTFPANADYLVKIEKNDN
ncbi:MAG: hypothetical protein PHS07_00150 [Patescibacteria group bacterium]|jgi:hypothetical protein|nr:hypothetical protein [Patescibacteria group bacterium]